jgi:hypothetical protein
VEKCAISSVFPTVLARQVDKTGGKSGHSTKKRSASIAVKRKTPRLSGARLRQTLHCLTLMLASGLVPGTAFARSKLRSAVPNPDDWPVPRPAPYLPLVGPPGLRFMEPEPAPSERPRIVVVGPPVPGLNATETSVAIANASAMRVTAPEPVPVAPAASTASSPPAPPAAPQGEPVPAVPTPPPILRDDMQPQVRAEDVLPFFRLPAAPPALPPSSATYTQTPK